MNKPFISIVIPTYNRFTYLKELMESLSKQTYTNFEVIIVNDGGERVDQIKELYPNLSIKVMNMEQNVYHVEARNVGVRHATGEYIMLIDDDDLIVPTHIETMVTEIGDHDLAYSDVEIVSFREDEKGRVPVSRLLFAYHFDLAAMRQFSTYVPSGSLYKKSIHQTIGLFDVDIHNYWDWDFFLRVSEVGRIKRVPMAGVLYDFSEANDNQSKDLSGRERFLNRLIEKHHLGELPTENFFTLLGRPEVEKRKAVSQIIWDGKLFWLPGEVRDN